MRLKTSKSKRRQINNSLTPSFSEEKLLRAEGYRYIAGIDEVGRGALAGPVVAAAVVLPTFIKAPWLDNVRDSKQLTPAKREYLFHFIHEKALSVGIGSADCEIVDTQGIAVATRLAMTLAVEQLSPPPEALLIDYMLLPGISLPQKGITRGDSLCYSIACASIIAKVTRDNWMIKIDDTYPGYGLARHKGYGTREHLSCLSRLGASPVHRRSFRPVREVMEK
ncbi:ribonuclease HII [Chloroflexota bacterium]